MCAKMINWTRIMETSNFSSNDVFGTKLWLYGLKEKFGRNNVPPKANSIDGTHTNYQA